MKRLALSALAAVACSIITVSAQAAPVAGLIHPLHVAALRRYYRHRIRTGGMILGDDQSPKRYVAHNESVARFFHQQLTAAVTAIVGEPVIGSGSLKTICPDTHAPRASIP